jgi:putative sterol carrier protein
MLQVKTPREFFDKVLPAKFDPTKVTGFEAVVQMNIMGPDGGDWIVTVKDQKLNVSEGIDLSPTITVKMSDIDYVDLINGKLSGVKAFMSGKLEFKGSIATGLRLMDMGIM